MNWIKPDLTKPTCRVCLKNKIDEKMSSIFDIDTELHDLRIYEKIERCAGIKLICDTKFATFICCHCNEFLKISYKFRTSCQNSEEYLKTIVETETTQPKNSEELFEQYDLPKEKNTSYEKSSCMSKRDVSPQPLSVPLKKHNNISCSPAQSESVKEFFSDDENDVWVDIQYRDVEDILSCSDINDTPQKILNSETEEEIDKCYTEKPQLKSRKRRYVRKKNSKKGLLKTSSDDAAIITEKKTRSKKQDIKQPQVCEICGNVYKTRGILEDHIKRHSDEKDFKCELCRYTCHSNCELKRHMRKHTGSRPYKCSHCTSAFGDHSTLRKHERVHRNERPFKCDICGSTFSYPDVLKRHKLVHTGEKPYKCEICGKCFNDRYHLQSHLKTIQHKNDPRVEQLIQDIYVKSANPPKKN